MKARATTVAALRSPRLTGSAPGPQIHATVTCSLCCLRLHPPCLFPDPYSLFPVHSWLQAQSVPGLGGYGRRGEGQGKGRAAVVVVPLVAEIGAVRVAALPQNNIF